MLAIIWSWVVSHQALLAALAVAISDFIFALKPDWASNGLVHWLWLKLKALAGSPPAA